MNFREIYEVHFAFVWRSLRRLGVREADLDDAVQEVFLVVHRRLPHFEHRAAMSTWLFRICLRAAKDRRRKASARREVLDDAPIERSVDSGPLAIEALERLADLELFDLALSRVDLDQRAVFVLFELEGLTGDQIAETLEIPLGTAYSRLRLAREAFKKAARQSRALRESLAPTGGMQ